MDEEKKKAAHIDIVFDGPPDNRAPRFIEIESGGESIRIGQWMERADGYHALRVTREDLERLADMPFMN